MTIALLTAAGSGTRMHQDIPKQFIHVDNKPVIIHTMEAFQKHPGIDAIIVVTIASWTDVLRAYARQFNITKLKWIVPGGETGQESIFNGLRTLKEDSQVPEDAIVMVHDGNRPMVSSIESDDGISSCTSTERERLFRTQTPHTYLLNDLYEAHLEAQKRGITGTAASCMLMKELGKTTWFSKGSEENLKITTLDDLRIFKALLHTAQDNWIKE